MRVQGLGVDMIEVQRFRGMQTKGRERFLEQTFSKIERDYCLAYRDPAPHFAGTFAAKEAIRKASGDFVLPLNTLEIRREKTGKPTVWLRGKRSKTLVISISHTKTMALAVALQRTI